MINRSNMLALDSMATLEEAIDFMLCSQYSRYPVYDESVDSIVGILYLKDALRLHSKDNLMNKPIKSIRKLLRKPVYIPETKKIDDILAELGSVAEGVKTSKALCELAVKLGIDVPVSNAIYEAVYTDITPKEIMDKLMNRKLKEED